MLVGVISLIAQCGVSSLMGNIGATLVTKSGNKIVDKLALGIGSAVIGGMVTKAAGDYVEGEINKVHTMLIEKKEEVENGGSEDGEGVSE